MAHSLRLIEDRLAAGAVAPTAPGPCVLYAREGALVAEGGGERAAALGPGALRARAAGGEAWVYRVETAHRYLTGSAVAARACTAGARGGGAADSRRTRNHAA